MFNGGLEFGGVATETTVMFEGVPVILDIDEVGRLVPLEDFAGPPNDDVGGTMVLLKDLAGVPGIDVRATIVLEDFPDIPGNPDLEVVGPMVPLEGLAGLPDIDGSEMIAFEDFAGASGVDERKTRVLLEDFTGMSDTDSIKSLEEVDDTLGTDEMDVIVSLEGISDIVGTDLAGMLDGVDGFLGGTEEIPYSEGEDSTDSREKIAEALEALDDGVAERVSGVREEDVVDTSGVGESICDFCGERTEPTGEGEVPFVMCSCRRNRAMPSLLEVDTTRTDQTPYVLDILDSPLAAHPREQTPINSRSRTLERNA